MKYEEIEVGESYETESCYAEKVLFKHDESRQVVTIDEDEGITSWHECQLGLFQPIKKELPESGLLVSKLGCLIYRIGEDIGYGFDSRGVFSNYDTWSFIVFPKHWKPATPEDESKFVKLLKAEAEKRGLGVDAKIKGHADNTLRYPMNDGKWNAMFNLTSGNNKNGRIFHNGIWAQPLTMLDEVCDTIKKHLPNIVVEQIDGVVTLKQL